MGEAARRLTDFGVHPAWSPDSRQIVFTTEEISDPYKRFGDSALWVIDAGGGLRRIAGQPGGVLYPLVSPDGRTIFYAGRREEADIWIVEIR